MEIRDNKLLEIIENYLYEVTRRLPEKQRKDIENELRGLIEDMLNERTSQNPTTIKDLEIVLNELGKPSELANKYRDYKRYLIGPEYFDKYVEVMKIVLYVVFLGTTLGSILLFIGTKQNGIDKMFSEVFSTVISTLFQAFAWITIGFAVNERINVNSLNKTDTKKEWSINNLTKIPRKHERIRKGEPIIGIIVIVIFMVSFNFTSQYIGLVSVADNYTAYSFFNLDVLSDLLPLINIIFILGLIREIAKFILGKYTLNLAVSITVINLISMSLVVFVFNRSDLYVADISKQLNEFLPIVINGKNVALFENASIIIISMFSLAFILDTGKALYKGIQSHNK